MSRKIGYDLRVVQGFAEKTREDRRDRMQERAELQNKRYPTASKLAPNVAAPTSPPAADLEGTFYYHKPGGGEPSVLYFCIAYNGGLEWISIGLSSL